MAFENSIEDTLKIGRTYSSYDRLDGVLTFKRFCILSLEVAVILSCQSEPSGQIPNPILVGSQGLGSAELNPFILGCIHC